MPIPVPIEAGLVEAAEVIANGGIVAFPTDTVYGVATDPWDEAAIRRLAELKARDPSKPIALLLSDASVLPRVCEQLTEVAKRLAREFLPGPLTMVVQASADLPHALSGGRGTVGVRVPNHDDACRFIHECGGILATTSANFSGRPPATSAAEVLAALGDGVDFVLDGGPTGVAEPSTVVDTTVVPPRILREGALASDVVTPHLRGSAPMASEGKCA